jgi:hypothetical protein
MPNRWVILIVVVGGVYLLLVMLRGYCCCLTDRCRRSICSSKVSPETLSSFHSPTFKDVAAPPRTYAFGAQSHLIAFHSPIVEHQPPDSPIPPQALFV